MVATYKIIENTNGEGFQPYGAAADYWRCKESEIMLSGPAETGKTRTGLEKEDACLWKYPGCQTVLIRKECSTIYGSVLQTYLRKVLTKDSPVKAYGGEKPQWFDYPNGSRLWIAGMDDPGKALSSERDRIYVNQAEDLDVSDWETLLTRATGRAGNTPYPQVGGDCNPSHPRHWIKQREKLGKLRLFNSVHEDNPTLFDPVTKQITEQGNRTLAILDGLTGTRFQRLRRGLWVSAEGAVYESYDQSIHLIAPFEIPKSWRRIRAIDFGYTHAFVCQWWAIDNDGRMFRYREIYRTKRLVEDHAKQINELSVGEEYEATIADHDAEDRATLQRSGIGTIPAMKAVSVGIQGVQTRLKVAGDGRARLFLIRGALVEQDPLLVEAKKPTCTEDEFPDYVWAKKGAAQNKDGSNLKEEPVKENDHGADATRYAVAYVDKLTADGVFEFKLNAPQTESRQTAKGVLAPSTEHLVSSAGGWN